MATPTESDPIIPADVGARRVLAALRVSSGKAAPIPRIPRPGPPPRPVSELAAAAVEGGRALLAALEASASPIANDGLASLLPRTPSNDTPDDAA